MASGEERQEGQGRDEGQTLLDLWREAGGSTSQERVANLLASWSQVDDLDLWFEWLIMETYSMLLVSRYWSDAFVLGQTGGWIPMTLTPLEFLGVNVKGMGMDPEPAGFAAMLLDNEIDEFECEARMIPSQPIQVRVWQEN